METEGILILNVFFSKIKEAVLTLFSKSTLSQAIGVSPAISAEMAENIALWHKMYAGKAPWVDNNGVFSLRLEQGIAREFANISLGEMTVSITNPTLEKLFKAALKDINLNLQSGLSTGAMVIKPLGERGVQYVSQEIFIPLEFDAAGKLTRVIFPEIKKLSESSYNIRLECHSLDKSGLTIENRAFHSSSPSFLGREIELASVPDWAELEAKNFYPRMKKMPFGYYHNPIKNTIDGTQNGMSIFSSAVELIKKADIQFGRLDWEFESGERAIILDDSALNLSNGKASLNRLNKRLYRGLNLQQGTNAELFHEFSPEFREQSIVAGLEEFKRCIEFAVGLSYGDISNPQAVEKTATEIISAKKRKYNTVTAIQRNLTDCLEDLAYAIAFYSGLATSGYEFICNFKDSILSDEETERKQDKEDVALGVMGLAEYRAKWYGESLEEAEKNLPKSAEVTP